MNGVEHVTGDLITRLQSLIHLLNLNLQDLQQPAVISDIKIALHSHDRLPDKQVATLANQAIDLLHETEQLLEPGPLVLADLFLGFMDSKCLVAAVELNVPYELSKGPLPIDQLATKCNARPDRLRQILRVLYNRGIFAFDSKTGMYSNNSTSELLLPNHWTQWRNWVDLYGNEFYDMAKGIPQQCRKDETRMAGQIVYQTDKTMFQHFSNDKSLLSRMHETLSGGAIAQAPGIIADYPWHEVAEARVLDIGGGQGGLIASLLRHNPSMRGAIFDMTPVIERAQNCFHGLNGEYADVGHRVLPEDLIAGDFLKEIPASEVYTMKWCLHDWDDTKALSLLTNIRRSITRGPLSRLIIMESLLADGRSSRLTRYADITMMISANGEERDKMQWSSLAAKTGWVLNRIHYLRNAWPCAIEMIPIWEEKVVKDLASSTTNGTANCMLEEVAKFREINEEKPPRRTNGLYKQLELPDGSQAVVSSDMSFLEPWSSEKTEPYYRSAPEEGYESTNFKWQDYKVVIADARPIKNEFTIEKNGFQYVDDTEGISDELLDQLRLNNKKLTSEVYYPRVRELVKKWTGASRIIIFDDTIRKRDPGLDKHENPNGREQPAAQVHCDQSRKGALKRLEQNIEVDESIEDILKGRVQLINVWRPLIGPVIDWPLAMMDFSTLRPEHVHTCTLYRGAMTERGQTMVFEQADDQKWYYLKHHRTDEVTMIKIWDSWGVPGGIIADCCPHSAFEHPDTPKDAAPRESIEVRCLAIYDP